MGRGKMENGGWKKRNRSYRTYPTHWPRGGEPKAKNDRFEFERLGEIPEIRPTAGPTYEAWLVL
jgi:hypothetical protein